MKKLLLTLTVLTLALPGKNLSAAEPNLPAAATNAMAEVDPQLLRSFLLLQEQLRLTQRAVELAREEGQTEARRTAEAMTARLNVIEQALNAQRQQELESMRRSTRTMVTVVGIITAVGFVAVLFAGFVQMRAMARLAEVSRQLGVALPALRQLELGAGPSSAGEAIGQTNANLLGAIDRLERRLEDVETSAGGTHTATNGHKQISLNAVAPSKASTILSKGQTLLNLGQPEEALAQFEQALEVEPNNVEAWIKKGTALERLQKIDEAIAAYDQAIAADHSTATAYLFKAGVYNRQKKYAEALQCYEKALSVQQKSRATQA